MSAIISDCGTYRYLLKRHTSDVLPPLPPEHYRGVLFIMLNPSTADATTNDATIVRCMGFARRWGYERMEVTNLFAYRSTDPANLKIGRTRDEAIGPYCNQYILEAAARADLIVCAWGVHGGLYERDVEVVDLLRDYRLHALKSTRWGKPAHPLYMRSDLNPIRFPFV